MKTAIENGTLVCFPEGIITSDNCDAMEADIRAALAAHPGLPLTLDAEGMTQISSAGLRALLRLSREFPGLRVRNVSPEVYRTFDITGFTSLLDVRRRPREISVEGCEVIGQGAVGTVYRLDADTVLKLYSDEAYYPMLENELKRARQAFLKGIPTAIPFDIVRVGDRFGAVFEMMKAENCNDVLRRDTAHPEEIVRRYADFLKSIHRVEAEPGELPDARERYRGYLRPVESRLPEATARKVRAMLDAMPDNFHVLHGDPQMKNVMISGGEMMLIDMDTLCVGDSVFELAGLYMSYVAFTELDPMDSVTFLGIDRDTIRRVYGLVLRAYAEDGAPADMPDRVALVGCLRYLYVLTELHMGREDLREAAVAWALENTICLADRVEALALG